MSIIVSKLYPKVIKEMNYDWRYYLDNVRIDNDSTYFLLKPLKELQNFQIYYGIPNIPNKYCNKYFVKTIHSVEIVFDKNNKLCRKRFTLGSV